MTSNRLMVFGILFLILSLVGCSSTPSDDRAVDTQPDRAVNPQESAELEDRVLRFQDLLSEMKIIHGNIERQANLVRGSLEDRAWDRAEDALAGLRELTVGFVELCNKAIELGSESNNPDVQDAMSMLKTLMPIMKRAMGKYSDLIEEGRRLYGSD